MPLGAFYSVLDVSLTENEHAERLGRFFPATERSAFHEKAMLDALSPRWISVLIADGAEAFHTSFVPQPIEATGLFDIEPFLGYAGFLSSSDRPEFVARALDAYASACRARGIVAELVRFDPILENHKT
ncbi:MAG: hypothetical protein JO359_01150, partial [Candidatus Eremiobacteraeota bacterium]|nr:hypothetical protein [Candidatus Eremiobacteraeota bacterium]